ncbi:MAG: hypothetical protein KAY24_18345, partial [Candidatus Eisenbacteria sp.]|nr:hypothetical protein [Candidatus Eisenbacteria bacterium]
MAPDRRTFIIFCWEATLSRQRARADQRAHSLLLNVMSGHRSAWTPIHEPQCAGNHGVRWNAEKLPSGVYFLRLDVGGRLIATHKILLA